MTDSKLFLALKHHHNQLSMTGFRNFEEAEALWKMTPAQVAKQQQ